MSMLIDRLMGRIRQKQIETIRSAMDEYREILNQAATDESSVDIDEADRVRELMGKSMEDFAADIETTRKRIAAAETLRNASQVKAEASAAQAKFDKLNAEAAAYREAQGLKIQAAWEEVKRLESMVSEIDNAKRTLLNTVIDPSLVERQNDNSAQQRELLDRKEEVLECIRQTNQQIVSCDAQADHFEDLANDPSVDKNKRAEFRERLKGYQGGRQTLDGQLQRQQSQLGEIEAELQRLQAEAAEIERLKLVP